MPYFDAVIVPGGGVRSGGELPPWVESRFEKAIEIASGAYIIALSAGTVHKPQPMFESVAGIAYLLRRGYPRQRLLLETSSYDTIGNAYFCRTIHTDPANLRRLAVVTSEFHMPRVEAAFRWIYAALPAPAYALSFFATPDTGMTEDGLAARRAREAESLAQLAPLIERHRTLAAIHRFLFTSHHAYAAGLRPTEPAAGPLLESY